MSTLQEAMPGQWEHDHGFQSRTLSTDKFTVTEVIHDQQHYVIKTAQDPAAQADLGNLVAWSEWIRAQQPETFSTPRSNIAGRHPNEGGQVIAGRAYIQWASGHHPSEDNLAGVIPHYADAVHEMTTMEVDWEADAGLWVRGKFHKVGAVALEHIQDKLLVSGIREITGSEQIDVTQPGVVHGDLVPKNTVIEDIDIEEIKMWLLDAEYGTHGLRPEFALPRMRDAAYLYHILLCQYNQPETAQTFLAELAKRFSGDNTWEQEFWIATLERTLSMYKFFVVDAPTGPHIDQRRLSPKPYLGLLRTATDQLLS